MHAVLGGNIPIENSHSFSTRFFTYTLKDCYITPPLPPFSICKRLFLLLLTVVNVFAKYCAT